MFAMGPAFFRKAAGGGGSTTTLDPSFKGAGVTLSGGNLVATGGSTGAGCTRSTVAMSGKQYFEVVITANPGSSSWAAGIINSSETASSSPGYSDANGWCYWATGQGVRHNGVVAVIDSSPAVGDVIMVAYDASAGNLWFGRNGTWLGAGSPNPGTGTAPNYSGLTGTMYAAVSPWASGAICTARFSASSFSYSIPTGFSAMP